jgi:hypothetical protein
MNGPLRSTTTLATLVLAPMLASGCGGSGSLAPQAYPAAAEQLVSATDLRRLDETSPAYALMAWWRDTQFDDRAGYLRHLTRGIRLRLDVSQVDRQLPILAAGIRTAKPQILSTEFAAGDATVYTKIVFRQPIGATRYVTTTRPQAFHLVRVGGTWHLSDTSFADSMTAAALSAMHKSDS